jgi:hypothetical protein
VPEQGDPPCTLASRVRIGFGPGPQQAGDGGCPEGGACRPVDCNFHGEQDKSFADDLAEATGRVISRVALLPRAGERQPERPRFVGGLYAYNLDVVPPLF